MAHLTVIPAYGRDYTTAKAARADWKAGKDFLIANFMHRYDGKPISIRDAGSESIMIRFDRMTKIAKA